MELKIIHYCQEQKTFWVIYNNKPMQAKIVEHQNKKFMYFLPQNKLIALPSTTMFFRPAKKQSDDTDHSTLKSPLSGSVVKIFIKPGQAVSPGEKLLTIESMKMENEIRALVSAVIQTIPIAEGFVVQQSQVLITQTPITSATRSDLVEKEDPYGKPGQHTNVKTQIQDW